MDIAYARGSRLLERCEAAIREHAQELHGGGAVYVDLPKGGYDGRVIVVIRRDDPKVFGTDWQRAEPNPIPRADQSGRDRLAEVRLRGPL